MPKTKVQNPAQKIINRILEECDAKTIVFYANALFRIYTNSFFETESLTGEDVFDKTLEEFDAIHDVQINDVDPEVEGEYWEQLDLSFVLDAHAQLVEEVRN